MAYIRLFREMWRYAGPDRWKIVVFTIFHLLSFLGTLAQPLIFAQILDEIQLGNTGLMHRLSFWFAAWAASFVWFNLFHRTGRYLEFNVIYKVKQRFINERYIAVTRLGLGWHTDHHSGETISRIDKAADALFSFGGNYYEYIQYFMLFWGPIVGLGTISVPAACIALVAATGIIILIKFFDNKLAVLYEIMNEMQRRLSSVLYDYIGNIKTIITLRLGQQTAAEVDHRLARGYKPYIKAEGIVNSTKWFFVTGSVLIFEAGIILFYIAHQIERDQIILVGTVTAIYQYLQQMAGTFYSVAEKYQGIVNWWISYQGTHQIISPETEDSNSYSTDFSWRHINLIDLNFSYQGTLALAGVSLDIGRGERIALVGESGSGKSTLMAVLRGLYQPESVALTVDGQAFDSLAPLSGFTTLIPQEPEIFENTIRYNITFGVAHSDEEVMEAVRLARFDIVLERLSNGLETDVRERGVTLSGGERQRLALARGLLAAADSSLILMDEPTSSVDAYNEALIYDNLFARFRDRAIISSIHRLHMLGRFDRVIVMERGRIAQTGSFEELKAADGAFRAMWEKSAHS